MNSNTREQQRLLIVDDSKVVRITARKILRDHFETVEAIDGENAWDILAGKEIFSLVISDLSMPGLDGFGLLERIRNSHLPHIRDLPVIIITGADDSQASKERATLAGATDFIGKPFDSVHLLARTQAHASAHSTARTLREQSLAQENESSVDPLTRLANEMAFMELGYQQLAYAIRHNTRLSVFYTEIDHYGDLSKTPGDRVSESIIQTVSTVLTTAIRHEDTAARVGTARFALLLPGLNNNGIQNLANRIRKSISERVLKHGNERIHFTISIGVAATEIRRNTRFDDLISVAKSRLANAIARGGDTVVYEGDDQPPPCRQPEKEMADAIEPGCRGVTNTQCDASPMQSGIIDTTLPAMTCRSAVISAAPPGESVAESSNVASHASSASARDTSTPPGVPDLSGAMEIAGVEIEILPPASYTANEIIEITADSNPDAPCRSTPGIGPASGPANPASGDTTGGNPGRACRHNKSRQTFAVRTGRISLLERLLTGVLTLFKRARPP